MSERTSILIADDEPTVLRVLEKVFSADPSFQVVATARDADEAVRLADEHRPDLALLDVRMPGGGGERCARDILLLAPETRILALSAYDDRGTVVQMLRAGAIGYVVKGASVSEILETVRRVTRGEPAFSAEAAAGVMDELSERLQTEEQETQLRRRQAERVRSVLTGEGLDMAFQPVVNLISRDTRGYEALARFNVEPRRGPDVWFSEAAHVGLGTELEVAAARLALEQLPRLGDGTFMSINVSPDVAMARSFLGLLDPLPVDGVVLELTEHAKVDDYDALNGALGALRTRGLRVAVDDAGAGFASLRHILQLSPDVIKLDISITRAINERSAHALATALVSFAGEIGAAIVAEGIETAEELAALQRLGVSYGQGYYLGRPGPLPPVGEEPNVVPAPSPETGSPVT